MCGFVVCGHTVSRCVVCGAVMPPSKKRRFSFESGSESDDAAIPRGEKPKPPAPTPTARPTKAVAAPKPTNPPKTATANTPPPPTKTDTPKGGGATAGKMDDRPDDLIVGTVPQVLYPTGVEKGTVRGVHGRKGGAIWVEYPGGTTLYEVARHLLFPAPEEAERYREEARLGKKKPKPPAPTNEETNPPNPNPTTEPTYPANPPSGSHYGVP